MLNKPKASERLKRSEGISIAAHLLLLLVVAGVFHRAPKIAPYKLPGTSQGVQLLTSYAPGSPKRATSEIAAKVPDKVKLTSPAHAAAAPPKPAEAQAPSVDSGSGSTAQSGLGEGQISIAFVKFFPHPTPDLSALPHGTKGDVILNAVIDAQGKITDLTLVKGLGPPVDDEVIAAVRQWTYNPATKNGTPVPSEQELHFHYERG